MKAAFEPREAYGPDGQDTPNGISPVDAMRRFMSPCMSWTVTPERFIGERTKTYVGHPHVSPTVDDLPEVARDIDLRQHAIARIARARVPMEPHISDGKLARQLHSCNAAACGVKRLTPVKCGVDPGDTMGMTNAPVPQ